MAKIADSNAEVEKRRDEALRRMLNTPRAPHEPVKAKPKTKTAKKRPAK